MDPKRRQKIDQSLAELKEVLPGGWWALYQGCLEKGFNSEKSFALVQLYMITCAGNPVFLPQSSPEAEERDEE